MFDNVDVFGGPSQQDAFETPSARPPSPMSGSPDGLGAHAVPVPRPDMYAQPNPGPGMAMAGELAWLEPPDVSPQAALRTAGITALVAAVAFGGGLALGGAWGGISGVLLSGSAFNVYRAQKWWGSADPSEKSEAVVSSFFAAAGIAAGGYAAYRAYGSKRE